MRLLTHNISHRKCLCKKHECFLGFVVLVQIESEFVRIAATAQPSEQRYTRDNV